MAIDSSKTLLKYVTVVRKPMIAAVKAGFYMSANSCSRERETVIRVSGVTMAREGA
jgi:hypothetical protein